MPRCVNPSAAPTTSTIASSAPTSWNSTRSTATPCTSRFGLGEAREDGERALADQRLEGAGRDQIADRRVGPMTVVVVVSRVRRVGMTAVHADLELRRRDPAALRPLRPHLDAVESERRHRVSHPLDRQTEVEQGADRHVTADA